MGIAFGSSPGCRLRRPDEELLRAGTEEARGSAHQAQDQLGRGYSGSIVKVNRDLQGVQNGIVDIGGFCFCFEASRLPLHAFQVMLPFGPMDPTVSLKIAQ